MNKKKIFILVLIVAILVSSLILITIPHFIIGEMVNMHVEFNKIYEAEEFDLESEKIILETEDGLEIVTYHVEAENSRGAVIFLSGIHNPSVTAFYGHAKWMRDLGLDSYLLEMRAHGESEGKVIALGYKEILDVDALVEYIMEKNEDNEKPIIIFGLSMGGAVAINSTGNNQDIDGAIALSAYSSFEDNFYDQLIMMEMPRGYASIQRRFVKLYTNFKYGFSMRDMYPKSQIKKAEDKPILLIHSSEDDQVPIENLYRLLENSPDSVSYWEREGNNHIIVMDDYFLKLYKDVEYREIIERHLEKIVR